MTISYEDLTPRSRAIRAWSIQRWRSRQCEIYAKPYPGLYYWVPNRHGDLTLLGFSNRLYGSEGSFAKIWRDVVCILSVFWNLPEDELQEGCRNLELGLSHGTVGRHGDSWSVVQCGDIPDGRELSEVLAIFNLAPDITEIQIVNATSDQQKAMQAIMKVLQDLKSANKNGREFQ